MSLELRVNQLEQDVKRLKKRAARFKRPSGPEELAMRLAALPDGHLVEAELVWYKWEAVDWKRSGSRLVNVDALLLWEIGWAKKRPQQQKPEKLEDYYGR